jgi:hypothetical protein
MVVRGATPQERAAVRAENTRTKRQKFYVDRIRGARDVPRQQLSFACDFAKAVGDGLDNDGRRKLAHQIALLAEEANKL